MFLRQISDSSLAQNAYLIGCQRSGEAVIIDPERDLDRYLQVAAENERLGAHSGRSDGIGTSLTMHRAEMLHCHVDGRYSARIKGIQQAPSSAREPKAMPMLVRSRVRRVTARRRASNSREENVLGR